MSPIRRFAFALVGWGFFVPSASAFRYWQEVTVPQAGLVRTRLPYETMGKAHAWEEIRLFDPMGAEIPLVIQGLELGISPKNAELDLMPVTFTSTPGTEFGTRLDIVPPLPHVVVDKMEVEVDEVGDVDLRAVKAGSRVTSSGEERVPPAGQYSQAEIVYLRGGSPFILAGWGGYAHDGYQWIGFLKSKSGREVQVRQVRARVRACHLVFNAKQPGTYLLRFGGDGRGTDPVLDYHHQGTLQAQVRAATTFLHARVGPIHGEDVAQEVLAHEEPKGMIANLNPERAPSPSIVEIEPVVETTPVPPIEGPHPATEMSSGTAPASPISEKIVQPSPKASKVVAIALWVAAAFIILMIVGLFAWFDPKSKQ